MWKHGSLADCPGKIVIPVELSSRKFVKYKVAQIRGAGGSSRYFPSKVELADWFPIEPVFSVTIHKANVSNPFVVYSCFVHDSYVTVYSSIGLAHRIRGGQYQNSYSLCQSILIVSHASVWRACTWLSPERSLKMTFACY